jgi:hypothetical protein
MRFALGSLSQNRQIPFAYLMTETMRELARAGLAVQPNGDFEAAWHRLRDTHPLSFLLLEGHNQLLTLGYIVQWPSTPRAPNPDYLHITEKGKQWISATDPVPEDATGFLQALSTLIPSLDSVIKQYIAEAVVTYNRQAWFASAVMVGAASEKAVYMLIESLLTVTGGSEGRAIEKAIKERNLPNMFQQINKVFTAHRDSGNLPYDVHEGCEHHLLSLFESIRVQRNEAVHPTVGQVTPATVRLTLSAFPSAFRKVYELINWCQNTLTHHDP